MRTNGFIFIALSFTAAALAATPGYLPGVGPVALRFTRDAAATPMVTLPAPSSVAEAASEAISPSDSAPEISAAAPTNSTPTDNSLMQGPLVMLPEVDTNAVPALIGPMMDSSGIIMPQTFLRFFTPPQGGVAREAVVVTPPGFNPARPPTPSSTVIYSQPKP